tara:strand:+ start:116 stop:856 length:741 start_codon:yes stop_codon:yes gene_type:complete
MHCEIDVCGGAYAAVDPGLAGQVTRVGHGVCVIEDALTHAECDALVRKAQVPGVLQASRTGGGMQPDRRQSWQARCQYRETPGVQAKLGRLMGVPVQHMEALKLIYYPTGGFFESHHDAFARSFDPRTGASDWACVAGGTWPNRVVTCIVYLNDVPGTGADTGRTVFDDIGVAVRPKKGRAVVFAPAYLPTSTYRPGQRRECMAHRGERCHADKYIATQWAWGCPYVAEKDPKSGLGPGALSDETV